MTVKLLLAAWEEAWCPGILETLTQVDVSM